MYKNLYIYVSLWLHFWEKFIHYIKFCFPLGNYFYFRKVKLLLLTVKSLNVIIMKISIRKALQSAFTCTYICQETLLSQAFFQLNLKSSPRDTDTCCLGHAAAEKFIHNAKNKSLIQTKFVYSI